MELESHRFGSVLVNRAGQSQDISRDTITIAKINRTMTNVCGHLSSSGCLHRFLANQFRLCGSFHSDSSPQLEQAIMNVIITKGVKSYGLSQKPVGFQSLTAT